MGRDSLADICSMRCTSGNRLPRAVLAFAAWAGMAVGGSALLVRHQWTAAAVAQQPPSQWPSGLRVQQDPARLTLLMTLHPQCPCSRASLHELDQLLSRSNGRVAVKVLLVIPKGAPAAWRNSELVHDAQSIPDVLIVFDDDGHDARLLGAVASGDVSLFDPAGALVFKGGITDGRGHEGDNTGLSAVLELVQGKEPRARRTPVFGCALEQGGR
jgi:hypothetical protein